MANRSTAKPARPRDPLRRDRPAPCGQVDSRSATDHFPSAARMAARRRSMPCLLMTATLAVTPGESICCDESRPGCLSAISTNSSKRRIRGYSVDTKPKNRRRAAHRGISQIRAWVVLERLRPPPTASGSASAPANAPAAGPAAPGRRCGHALAAPAKTGSDPRVPGRAPWNRQGYDLHSSITRLVLGLAQQIRTWPGPGWSRGSSRYSTSPLVKSEMQVWQMPDRQL